MREQRLAYKALSVPEFEAHLVRLEWSTSTKTERTCLA